MEKMWGRAAIGAIVMCVVFLVIAPSLRHNSEISSKWTLVEYTVNGQNVKAENLSSAEKEISPSFVCKDGKSCVLSLNGKDHKGHITYLERGKYSISFDDANQGMTANISGKKLTLTSDSKNITIIFEDK